MFFKCYYSQARILNNDLFDIGFSCKCSSTLWNLYKKKLQLTSKDADILYKNMSEFDESKEHFALADAKCQAVAYLKIKKILES